MQDDSTLEVKIKELQLGLMEAINDLKRIPFWSKSHENATLLIKDYQESLSINNHRKTLRLATILLLLVRLASSGSNRAGPSTFSTNLGSTVTFA